ncbi:hypothetical protein QA5_00544 [Enterococcus faecalis EnGen0083]|uniref:DUF5406 family protein n=1 Tax=Enterococcus faecalis TaxID=1351 RepID=UPI00032EBF9C|nr:DUF5406 family protein [Enterococcus faecalis]DAU70123.1 MAG TPA: protein of unknown function (DUF5406) [Caudoviricetes sp.]EOE02790.1 hypothetical protein Q9K_00398 [Enterococcus faecalis EnGen0075]EOE18005.1 hypothetical protein Q9W_00908 [Enterococcus faecalis EnGen0060]EOE25024.1 hypothetical protein QA5_00544 [Enterococcus faecalis EnGen0083]HBI1997692.1 DUF5406 family protein [Enterococcus faecalis]
MKIYDPNIFLGLHTIKVSFQQWDYKGYLTFVKSGNCKGLDVLRIDADDLYDMKFKENPVNFRLLGANDGGEEWFAMTLKNDKKDEILVEDEWECLKDYIVGVEIVDFVEEEAE